MACCREIRLLVVFAVCWLMHLLDYISLCLQLSVCDVYIIFDCNMTCVNLW